ncbi:MAG: hypothetical protein WAJ93_13010 [Candidatus Nitrosopolaris sp.]
MYLDRKSFLNLDCKGLDNLSMSLQLANTGTGTVSNILDEWKRAVQGSDYESLREFAIHCKKGCVNLPDLT